MWFRIFTEDNSLSDLSWGVVVLGRYMLSGDFRNHKNASTIYGGGGDDGAASTVTLPNHYPRGSSAKGNIGASRKRLTLSKIDKNVEIGGFLRGVIVLTDRTNKRERISKLFNSRNQPIPQIVLDGTVGCKISALALGDHSDDGPVQVNASPGPITSDGSIEIHNVTLAELRSRTKGPRYVCC
ncbi:hypothetical protein PIB30_060730 [Stylosanthes scabra]|uniref:Uncharacterized protein n=1 Tax=Stylosanthes scabra TaxID=79078 RepID=A0ABU6QKA4_9FABA|nr:hypothetical protein [Stylosanthes scabra]